MKWKYVLTGGTFIGAIALGAMFAPLDEPAAKTNGKMVPVVQTANKNVTPQPGQANGTCVMTGQQMERGSGMGKIFAGTMPKVIADALGMTVDELQAARTEGKSVADLAKEKGVKLDKLTEAMIDSRKAQLEKLVKDGTITQEQMDTMLASMKTMMEQAIQRDTIGPMNGSGGGMGAGHGRWSSETANQPSETGSGV